MISLYFILQLVVRLSAFNKSESIYEECILHSSNPQV